MPTMQIIPVSYTHLDVYKRQAYSKRQKGKSDKSQCRKSLRPEMCIRDSFKTAVAELHQIFDLVVAELVPQHEIFDLVKAELVPQLDKR